MKTRWFAVLLGLNLALFGLCCLLVIRMSSDDKARDIATAERQAETAAGSVPAKPASTAAPAAEKSAVILQTNAFHWSQIESGDYRTYIANLRAIGCPEVTIKDIILTDIMKLFAGKRGQHFHNGREFRYWETNEKRALTARQVAERERALAKIDKQVPTVLRELLGLNYERELNKYFVDAQEDDRRLAFLPEAKRQQLLALREQVEDLRERIFEKAEQGQAPDTATLQQIENQRHEWLAGVLSPEELEEYDLRTSETAERLRTELVGFNPTEEEFRAIFRLARGGSEPADWQRVEQQIKSQLSPDRLAEWERSRNKSYQDLCFLAQEFELPQQTARTVFDFKQVAEQERQRVLTDKALGEQTRQAALQALSSETLSSVRQMMGDAAFASYLQGRGQWLQTLGAVSGPQ